MFQPGRLAHTMHGSVGYDTTAIVTTLGTRHVAFGGTRTARPLCGDTDMACWR